MLLIVRFLTSNDIACSLHPGPQITEVQRNQIMGHARADVFRRHYLHQVVKVDTQSAYLGTVNRSDLVATVGLMNANRDPRAPVKLSTGDLKQHKSYQKLAGKGQL
jgi:hypothetical protein